MDVNGAKIEHTKQVMMCKKNLFGVQNDNKYNFEFGFACFYHFIPQSVFFNTYKIQFK
jgi:hypothetical protein